MKLTWLLTAFAGFISISAVAATPACSVPLSVNENPNVTKGDFSPSVLFSAVTLSKHSVGYGASAQRADEITVADGSLYLLSKDKGGKVLTRHQANKGEGAVVYVVASPNAWQEKGKTEGISSFDGLDFAVDEAIASLKCDDAAVVPFKIIGHAKRVVWSVVDGPSHELTQTHQNVDVQLVGIYAKQDKARLHMVKGYNLHAHVVIPSLDMAGHIHDIDLADGATIYLPAN